MYHKIGWMMAVLALCLLSSCAKSSLSDDGQDPLANVPVPITFTTYTTAMSGTRAGYEGLITDDDRLRDLGFGVYAFTTDSKAWAEWTKTAPNFMYNEHVSYEYVSAAEREWMYTPLKYWPNDNQPADNATAQGSQLHSYVSFFAYAPYVGNDDGTMPAPADGEAGIIGESSNTAAGEPWIQYRWSSDIDRQVDLLWDAKKDLYRMGELDGKHYGYVDGRVQFDFKHALSCIELYVQRVYDEVEFSGKKPDNDVDTKIFVSSLALTPTDMTLNTTGKFNLATGAWDYTGAETTAGAIRFAATDFVNTLSGDPSTGIPATEDELTTLRVNELDKFAMTNAETGAVIATGVDEVQRQLTQSNRLMMLIPQTGVKLTPSITYSFLTQDNELLLSKLTDSKGNRYVRIVNTVEGDPIADLKFEGGKRYKLLCLIGVEHVSFEVIGIEDWDFPIRILPSVEPWTEGINSERVVDEPL